jgi:hypothetical protein
MKDATEAAKAMSDFVNNMGLDEDAFVEAMGREHRTLQQSFTGLCFAWIRHCAEKHEAGLYDGRNEAACRTSAEIVEKVEQVQVGLPMI